jgi:hypothetical protein
MDDDLITRLRAQEHVLVCAQAADRLEALQAEVGRVKSQAGLLHSSLAELYDIIEDRLDVNDDSEIEVYCDRARGLIESIDPMALRFEAAASQLPPLGKPSEGEEPPAIVPKGWCFARYVHGKRMAEGAEINKAATFEEAALSVARLFADCPGSVFVLEAPTPSVSVEELARVMSDALWADTPKRAHNYDLTSEHCRNDYRCMARAVLSHLRNGVPLKP